MSDPCEACLNNQQDEYGSWYCAEGGALDKTAPDTKAEEGTDHE